MFCKKLSLRSIICVTGLLIGLNMLGHTAVSANTTFDYSRMTAYIRNGNLEEPLVLFADSDGEFDGRLNKENLAYLNQSQSLLENIQQRLAVESLRWKLNGSSKRLLVVPEQRSGYADLFERYCKTAVNTALALTGLPNPYTAITTLKEPVLPPASDGSGGITAYLVHNIADEYIEEYLFFNQESDSKKVKIKLRNRVFTGRIGSYTSKLTFGENNMVRFEREPYTLWQNSAKNPLNVFVAPVEETLHIALRDTTEKAIKARIAHKLPNSIEEVERIVEEWIAVEEAVVGGLVAKVMPVIFDRFMPELSAEQVSASLDEREVHQQYRFVQNGVKAVTEMGILTSIKLYTDNPEHFKKLVCPPSIAVPPVARISSQNG